MLPRFQYRQFHDQTNIAAATLVVLAEFGIAGFDPSARGQELELHGLLQLGRYEESRGFLFRNALKWLFDAGLPGMVFHDRDRAAQLQARLAAADAESKFQFYSDLGAQAGRPLSLERDFEGDARVLLVEARHASRSLPIHILVARREGETFYVMNTATGQDHEYKAAHLAMHFASPVHAGAIGFAGRQYLYTGIAVRVDPVRGGRVLGPPKLVCDPVTEQRKMRL